MYWNLHRSLEAYQLKKEEVNPIKLQASKNFLIWLRVQAPHINTQSSRTFLISQCFFFLLCFVGFAVLQTRDIVMHPSKWAKVWYSYILGSCGLPLPKHFQRSHLLPLWMSLEGRSHYAKSRSLAHLFGFVMSLSFLGLCSLQKNSFVPCGKFNPTNNS
jgi:hypothetical protein